MKRMKSTASRKGLISGTEIIFLVFVALLFLGWIFLYSQRECKSNNDCETDAYCGSDFSCHKYPTVTQEKIIEKSDYAPAAFLLGLSIVIAAIILRGWKRKPEKHDQPQKEERKDANAFERYGEDANPPKHH